jgi:nucleotide-binding universal stress UspA family protein
MDHAFPPASIIVGIHGSNAAVGAVNHGVVDYLAKHADLAQLVVVGGDDPRLVPELTGPHADSVLRHTNCSVMSVR